MADMKYMLSFSSPKSGSPMRFKYGNTFKDIQNMAQDLRSKGFVVEKMGKTQPIRDLKLFRD